MSLPSNFEDLIVEAETLNLYKQLIIQLNKDFLLANIDLELNEETLPTSLKLVLKDTIFSLITHKFSDYLNLLYQVDVPENKIRALDGEDTVRLSENVTFLILQREWQKVWWKTSMS